MSATDSRSPKPKIMTTTPSAVTRFDCIATPLNAARAPRNVTAAAMSARRFEGGLTSGADDLSAAEGEIRAANQAGTMDPAAASNRATSSGTQTACAGIVKYAGWSAGRPGTSPTRGTAARASPSPARTPSSPPNRPTKTASPVTIPATYQRSAPTHLSSAHERLRAARLAPAVVMAVTAATSDETPASAVTTVFIALIWVRARPLSAFRMSAVVWGRPRGATALIRLTSAVVDEPGLALISSRFGAVSPDRFFATAGLTIPYVVLWYWSAPRVSTTPTTWKSKRPIPGWLIATRSPRRMFS